jgi:hypothetical protein
MKHPAAAIAVTIAIASLVGLLMVPVADSASEARLDGKFSIVGFSDGKTKRRDFTFTPLCGRGVCRKVALRREGPHQQHFRSTLKHTKRRGMYKGREHKQVVGHCGSGEKVYQVAKHRLFVVRAEKGRATAIRGRIKFIISGCERDVVKAFYFGERR